MKRRKPRGLAALLLLIALLTGCGAPQATTAEEMLTQGEIHLNGQNYEKALSQYLHVMKTEPDNPEGYLGAAKAYMGLSRKEAAAAVLNQGLKEVEPARAEPLQTMLAGLDDYVTTAPASAPPSDAPMTMTPDASALPSQADSDQVVQWKDPAFERVIRIGLNKPEGDITTGELDEIARLAILGDTHCVINGQSDYEYAYCIASDAKLTAYYNITDAQDNTTRYTERGDIQSVEDIVNFRYLENLTLVANHVSDLTPLLEMGTQLDGHCQLFGNDITDTELLTRFVIDGDVQFEQGIELEDVIEAYQD